MEIDRDAALAPIHKYFSKRRWSPFPYQAEAWQSYLQGKHGLISVPTGYGKTMAATMGPIAEALLNPPKGMFLLYVSPLKALTRDLSGALVRVIKELGADFSIECRTGDTSASRKAKQRLKAPHILFTTPESLSLLLSYADNERMFKHLRAVVVDEWHELVASKRGVQTQLGLTTLKKLAPEARVWGLSATLGNLEQAAEALVGPHTPYHLIRARLPKEIELESVQPESLDSFPWTGHLGLKLLPEMVRRLSPRHSTLIFTNTRSQCERWHQALVEALPKFAAKIAIHHSAIEGKERERVEDGLRDGKIKWVVCTASLDLGVDFQRVEQTVQVGSAKSLARMIQRAGRSQHRPGEPSRLLLVPTNSWELVELEAARAALNDGVVEPRIPLNKPIDVLVQHLVTLACGEGFREEEFDVIRQSYAYRDLTREEFNWVLQFIRYGGKTLRAYPQYQKIFQDETGLYLVRSSWIARQHRMSIGTITTSAQLSLMLGRNKRIGSIEESFISRLKRGDVFYFAGRKLEFVLLRDMKAFVKISRLNSKVTPSWAGTQLPLSESLSGYFQRQLALRPKPELKPLYSAQSEISRLPAADQLLLETWESREGHHLFIFPFAGRFVHEGLAAIWTYRLAHLEKASFTFSVNDYGLEILGPKDYPYEHLIDDDFFAATQLELQIDSTLNMTEMCLRRFRGIAQTAGLVFSGYPGARKTGKQIQVSSSLLYEIFRKYDPESLIFRQARSEVLDLQLDLERIRHTLEHLSTRPKIWSKTTRPSPLALPIWAERIAAHLSTETLAERIERMKKEWTKPA